VFSLAGDAFCLAATALGLTVLPKEKKPELPEVSLKEVAFHDSGQDCWIVVYDLVYDVTSFLDLVSKHMNAITRYEIQLSEMKALTRRLLLH